jgi:hypothetical protein
LEAEMKKKIVIGLLLFSLPAIACVGLSQGEAMGGAQQSGSQLQTQDAATEAALETEIAAGSRPPTLEILQASIDSYSCSPHPPIVGETHDPDRDGYDCTYQLTYHVAYEIPQWGQIQCYFSGAEAEIVNAEPGTGTLPISVTLGPILVFPPGTSFSGFCDLSDQATSEWLARGGDNVSAWIEVSAP